MQNKLAYFKFFNELTDFLIKKKDNLVAYEFTGNPSVKDAIESIGIPHTEVDVIYANGLPVDFSYNLKVNDIFEVSPANSNKDGIHLLCKISDYKFILDVHLGKLARYLRMLGFDSMYENFFTDEYIISQSIEENRIILTRDIGILKNGKVKLGYWIRNQQPRKQLFEILNHFNISELIKPFSICIKCNGLLTTIDKKEIDNRLEPLTDKFYNEFYICKKCKSIFWKGSHYLKMKDFIKSIRKGNF